jgi:anti-anti-sigma regulatory factor
MAIRISGSTGGGVRTVRVEGRLDAGFVADLLAESGSSEPGLRLDLSGLQWADRDGVGALLSLQAGGAVLVGASPFLQELLGASATEGR